MNATYYCNDCNYNGTSKYYYDRHIKSSSHMKFVNYKKTYSEIHSSMFLVDSNIQLIENINKLNYYELKNYDNWLLQNLPKENLPKLINNNLSQKYDEIFKDPAPALTKISYSACPWCVEYNHVIKLTNNNPPKFNTPKMTITDCLEHMKSCSHKEDHINLEKNLSQTSSEAFKLLDTLIKNFKILSTKYEQNQNKHKLLKKKYSNLEIKYEELRTSKDNKTCIAVNGNNNKVQFMTVINNYYKDAIPIDAPNTDAKMIENRYLNLYKQLNKKQAVNEEIKDICLIDSTESKNKKILPVIQTIPMEIDLSANYGYAKKILNAYNDSDKNRYVDYIAEFIIQYHKPTDNPSGQAILNTDVSRKSYVIKIQPGDWIKDIKGQKILEICITPLLKLITEMISEYGDYIAFEAIPQLKKDFMKNTEEMYNKLRGKKNIYNFKSLKDCKICNDRYGNITYGDKFEADIKRNNSIIVKLAQIIATINDSTFIAKVLAKISRNFHIDKDALMQLNLSSPVSNGG